MSTAHSMGNPGNEGQHSRDEDGCCDGSSECEVGDPHFVATVVWFTFACFDKVDLKHE